MKMIFRISFVIIIFFLMLFIRGKIVKIAGEITHLEKEILKKEEEIGKLRKEIAEMEKYENIEKIAKKKGILK